LTSTCCAAGALGAEDPKSDPKEAELLAETAVCGLAAKRPPRALLLLLLLLPASAPLDDAAVEEAPNNEDPDAAELAPNNPPSLAPKSPPFPPPNRPPEELEAEDAEPKSRPAPLVEGSVGSEVPKPRRGLPFDLLGKPVGGGIRSFSSSAPEAERLPNGSPFPLPWFELPRPEKKSLRLPNVGVSISDCVFASPHISKAPLSKAKWSDRFTRRRGAREAKLVS